MREPISRDDQMHPDVARIERLLGRESVELTRAIREGTVVRAESALWICPCGTLDEAPTWLVIAEAGSAAWARVPDEIDPVNVVTTSTWCGGHTEPESVLAWLEGEAAWAECGGFGDADTVEQVRQLLLSR